MPPGVSPGAGGMGGRGPLHEQVQVRDPIDARSCAFQVAKGALRLSRFVPTPGFRHRSWRGRHCPPTAAPGRHSVLRKAGNPARTSGWHRFQLATTALDWIIPFEWPRRFHDEDHSGLRRRVPGAVPGYGGGSRRPTTAPAVFGGAFPGVFLATAGPAAAQTATGQITGAITDATGATVTGVRIKITNTL